MVKAVKTIKYLTKENVNFETLGMISNDLIKKVESNDDIKQAMADFANILGDTGLSFNYLFNDDAVNIFGNVEGNLLDYTRDKQQEMIEIYDPNNKSIIFRCLYDVTTKESTGSIQVTLPLKTTETEDMYMVSKKDIKNILNRIPSLTKAFKKMGGKINERETYKQCKQFLLQQKEQLGSTTEKEKKQKGTRK